MNDNELIDLKGIWNQFVDVWRSNFGSIFLCVITFAFGTAWGTKTIVDDCKFSKNFRDGSTVYECQMRIR